jgi:hypothetical protein
MTIDRFRRKQAAQALTERGYPISAAQLAKFACTGEGPEITYFGRYPIYPADKLFAWAEARSSRLVRSTAEHLANRAA